MRKIDFSKLDKYELISSQKIDDIASEGYLLRHKKSGARIALLNNDDDNKVVFDNVIICTDRVVVDRQLQDAVKNLEHKSGFLRVMDDKCTSADLAVALQSNTKIIVTTIQKFPYVADTVSDMKGKTFAVIIDEAHSSTAGKNMAAVNVVLSAGELTEEQADMEDVIMEQIAHNGKQSNVSMFAFTATPKATTLQLFGRQNVNGQRGAFHVYSMKQAIEEGFILDVLQNYTTYETYYKLNKEIEDDPTYKTNPARRAIARFVSLHENNISQRIEIIIEHFRTTVMKELGGHAKAMVITSSRAEAVKYNNRMQFRAGASGAYTKSRINGWLDDFYPKKH